MRTWRARARGVGARGTVTSFVHRGNNFTNIYRNIDSNKRKREADDTRVLLPLLETLLSEAVIPEEPLTNTAEPVLGGILEAAKRFSKNGQIPTHTQADE